jgi:hypothetical protein
MSEEQAKSITAAFVQLNIKAFEGDVIAQKAVVVYREWFKMASLMAVFTNL